MKTLSIVSALLLVGGVVNLQSQTVQDVFTRGNEYYRSGKFQEASAEFESILKQGYESAELYFNLGNAYYRNANTARAILAYERALRLHPNDGDITHNLRIAQLKTVDRIDPVPELFFVHWVRSVASYASLSATSTLFLLMWVLTFSSLSVLMVTGRANVVRAFRVVFIISAVVALLAGAMLALQFVAASSRDQAIIVVQTVTAKSSPDEQSVDAFVIHEGLKVRMSDAVGDWVKITLADGKVGWVRLQQLERI